MIQPCKCYYCLCETRKEARRQGHCLVQGSLLEPIYTKSLTCLALRTSHRAPRLFFHIQLSLVPQHVTRKLICVLDSDHRISSHFVPSSNLVGTIPGAHSVAPRYCPTQPSCGL